MYEKIKICLDPGHGGDDPGAIGPHGSKEKDIVLDVCVGLFDILAQKGHQCILTRSQDKSLTLKERVQIGSECDIMISVHCNSFRNESVTGIETIYNDEVMYSDLLARCIQDFLIMIRVDGHNHKDRGIKVSPSPSFPKNLYITKHSKVPTVLVELEFLSNPEMEIYLGSSDSQIAGQLYSGIQKYINSRYWLDRPQP